jgi:excisionase family DNA binding protein
MPGSTGHSQQVLVRLTYLTCMDDSQTQTPVFLTQSQVAELLRLPVRTVESWRLTRSGPSWVKLGRHVRYEQSDLLAWVERHRHG